MIYAFPYFVEAGKRFHPLVLIHCFIENFNNHYYKKLLFCKAHFIAFRLVFRTSETGKSGDSVELEKCAVEAVCKLKIH